MLMEARTDPTSSYFLRRARLTAETRVDGCRGRHSVAHQLHFYHCEDRLSGMTQELQFLEFHEPQRVPSLDSLRSTRTVVGPVPGVHPLMCCGDTTLAVASTTFPPVVAERLVVPPNTTCTWTIEPVDNALHVELILVREHLAASDLMAIFLGSDTGMVSTSVGYKATNWTMLISVRLSPLHRFNTLPRWFVTVGLGVRRESWQNHTTAVTHLDTPRHT